MFTYDGFSGRPRSHGLPFVTTILDIPPSMAQQASDVYDFIDLVHKTEHCRWFCSHVWHFWTRSEVFPDTDEVRWALLATRRMSFLCKALERYIHPFHLVKL